MKKALILGTAIICFVAMTGCKTKPPKVAHPYVKEYVASYKTGSVNVKDFLEHGEEFAIGADENGKAVIECYNNQYSTPLIIQAETLGKDGQIGSMRYSTIGQIE